MQTYKSNYHQADFITSNAVAADTVTWLSSELLTHDCASEDWQAAFTAVAKSVGTAGSEAKKYLKHIVDMIHQQ